MNNNLWKVSIGLFVIAMALSIFSLYKGETKQDPYKMSTFKQSFVTACAAEGNLAYCTCAYDKWEAKIGVDKVLQESLEYEQTHQLSDNMLAAASSCLYLTK